MYFLNISVAILNVLDNYPPPLYDDFGELDIDAELGELVLGGNNIGVIMVNQCVA